jgi:hypothetical protein
MTGCAHDRRTSVINLVFAQTETRLIVIEVFQRHQTRVKLATLVIGMTAGAALNIFNLSVISFALRHLLPNGGMAGKTKNILRAS